MNNELILIHHELNTYIIQIPLNFNLWHFLIPRSHSIYRIKFSHRVFLGRYRVLDIVSQTFLVIDDLLTA